MLLKFESDKRDEWKLPCFVDVKKIILSDSQFRDIQESDTQSSEYLVVFRGCSCPDLCNLLCVGRATYTGCEFDLI